MKKTRRNENVTVKMKQIDTKFKEEETEGKVNLETDPEKKRENYARKRIN